MMLVATRLLKSVFCYPLARLRLGGLALPLAALLGVPVGPASAQLANAPWPMFHHDLQHTGRSPYTGPCAPVEKWACELTGNVGFSHSSPAVGTDGTIYVGTYDYVDTNNLHAVNPDGTLEWSFDTGANVFSSPAVGADGTIYVVAMSPANTLYAVDPNGALEWAFALGGNSYSAPAVWTDGTIYVGTFSPGGLYAVNPNGTLKWSLGNAVVGNVVSSPAIGTDGTIYVGGEYLASFFALLAVNPNGTLEWNFITNGSMISSPAVGSDGTIYAGSMDNNLYAVNPNGTQQWAFATGDSIYYSSPAIGADGTIYVGSKDLYAVNPNGTEKWSFNTGDDVNFSSPLVGADGTIYFGDGGLFAVTPDGTLEWSYFTSGPHPMSSPALGADGTLYVVVNDGQLYALAGCDFDITPFCFGDNTDQPCPCGNAFGATGNGCQNSANNLGANLSGSGSAIIGTGDTVSITATGVRKGNPTLALFFSGAVVGQHPVNDGLICAGSPLCRLWKWKSPGPAGGVITLTGPDATTIPDTSIPPNDTISGRSAVVGCPCLNGETRVYTVWYRDPLILWACPPPATSNYTNGLKIVWVGP